MAGESGNHAGLAVVTGANRGIGFEVCRQLGTQGFRVVLAARDPAKGKDAAEELQGEGLNVAFQHMSVTAAASIAAFAQAAAEWGPIDALVNNAGVSMNGFDAQVVRGTMAVNVFGVMDVTAALLPLLAPNGRIVNVSSGMGELSGQSAALRERLLDGALSLDGLRELLEEFAVAVEAGRHGREGWPSSAYSVSKAALNTFTRIQARALEGTGRTINSVCPGWVRTEMGGRFAARGVNKGAETIVWAAVGPPGAPNGKFFRDKAEIAW